ncbi:HAD-IIIA family hydrolase [Nocardia kruczakiae]|uniref:HAD-IIIA family hydrolase n=1 Tax=Nocardia kruczakiae TaxID=261477 RepID=UPI0009FC9721
MNGHVLVARLDSAGDVLLTGPAVRAIAARAQRVSFLAGPRGRAAAQLLPGVSQVLEFHAGWVDFDAPPVDAESIAELVKLVDTQQPDEAIIFTSFHQSPLPLALVLRMAGVGRISAISPDYPGSLLDVRHQLDDDVPEAIRALSLAEAAGYPSVGHRLRVRTDLPDVSALTGGPGYIVLHPGAAVPARRMSAQRSRAVAHALAEEGYRVVVTGGPEERELTATVAGAHARDLGGATDLPQLAAVLRGADVVVAPNTGAAHLAAAVATPVVSLFAPVVPQIRWAPHGVPCVVLGDRAAACAGTRARECPIPGHPCLNRISDEQIVDAVAHLRGEKPRRSTTAERHGGPPAVLFDRDDTLIIDVPYLSDPQLVEPVPGAAAELDRLRRAGVRIGVVSNQSGVGAGTITPEQLAAVTAKVEDLLGPVDTWQICPHRRDEGCECRKPQPGLVVSAAEALGTTPDRCVVIGDIGSDVEAAAAAGARAVLVPTAKTRPSEIAFAAVVAHVAPDLRTAVSLALAELDGKDTLP